jgi:Tocopherol cyclase
MLAAYRRTGADPPFGDPRGHHGVAMEGYFWRLTDVAAGRVVIALVAVNRDATGATWASVGLAAHPGGFVRTAPVVAHAEADPRTLRVQAAHGAGEPPVVMAGADEVAIDLGPGARLRARFADVVPWPRRAFGGIGAAQVLPWLGQYWHPHLLDARVEGEAELEDRRVALDGARAYGEKNWGRDGFPRVWWWGQAHGFDDPDVCVAFAGGRLRAGPAGFAATAIVVRIADELVHVVAPPRPLRARVADGAWELTARTVRGFVRVEGRATVAPHRLPVPLPNERRVVENASAQHLAGDLHVQVREGRRMRYVGGTRLAGLEQGTPLWTEAG